MFLLGRRQCRPLRSHPFFARNYIFWLPMAERLAKVSIVIEEASWSWRSSRGPMILIVGALIAIAHSLDDAGKNSDLILRIRDHVT